MRFIYTTSLVILLQLFLFLQVSAQVDKPAASFTGTILDKYPVQLLKNKFRTFTAVQLPSKELAAFCRNGAYKNSLHLQLGTALDVDLELEPSNLVSPNYKLQIITPQGTKTLDTKPDFLYKGKSKEGGAVRLAIKEGFISGSILNGKKEYFIEPMRRYAAEAGTDDFIVYQPTDLVDTVFSCGYNDASRSARNSIAQRTDSVLSIQDNLCKKVKFVIVADYSMYQTFNYDAGAVEAELLADLNAAEMFFSGFSFDGDLSTDSGTDLVKFEVTNLVVSTCKACDVIADPYLSGLIFVRFAPWIKKNIPVEGLQVHQYWTTYELNIGGPIIGLAGQYGNGCADTLMQLHHFGGGIPVLRIQIAHETGHNLGCQHDNAVKSSVKSFIMNGGLRVNATRFSQLTDFDGIRYSSKLVIRDTIKSYSTCPGACDVPPCDLVTGLKIDSSYAGAGVRIAWNGGGEFVVKYKLQQDSGFDQLNTKAVSGNSIVLTNLDPCSAYYLEVQKNCADGRALHTGITLSTFYLLATASPVNLHGKLYDLSVHFKKVFANEKDIFLKIDHQGAFLKIPAGQEDATISNLFADGARHRLDILLDTNSTVCKKFIYYKAPYYRADSKKFLAADFSNCLFPAQWKDTIFIKAPADYIDPQFTISDSSFFNYLQLPGNIDGSCMLFYENLGQHTYNGNLSFISSPLDIEPIKDPMLSFDYMFLAYGKKDDPGYIAASFSVQVFDENGWQEVFRLENNSHVTMVYRNIWDTVPNRVFIPLKIYSNPKLKVQFVMDDGSKAGVQGPYFFTAIDNVLIDGYDSSNVAVNNFVFNIAPNPASDVIFIKDLQPGEKYTYTITDVLGRMINKEMLVTNRIDIRNLAVGVYFITVLNNRTQKSSTRRIIKFKL